MLAAGASGAELVEDDADELPVPELELVFELPCPGADELAALVVELADDSAAELDTELEVGLPAADWGDELGVLPVELVFWVELVLWVELAAVVVEPDPG